MDMPKVVHHSTLSHHGSGRHQMPLSYTMDVGKVLHHSTLDAWLHEPARTAKVKIPICFAVVHRCLDGS
jgi:hypothetical protein